VGRAAAEPADAAERPHQHGLYSEQPVAPYVGVGWRVLGLANHVSHGPDYMVGVVLYEHLRVGIAGFAKSKSH